MRNISYDQLVKELEQQLNICSQDVSRQILILNGYINSVPEDGKMYLMKLAPEETMIKVREYMVDRRTHLRLELKKPF